MGMEAIAYKGFQIVIKSGPSALLKQSSKLWVKYIRTRKRPERRLCEVGSVSENLPVSKRLTNLVCGMHGLGSMSKVSEPLYGQESKI